MESILIEKIKSPRSVIPSKDNPPPEMNEWIYQFQVCIYKNKKKNLIRTINFNFSCPEGLNQNQKQNLRQDQFGVKKRNIIERTREAISSLSLRLIIETNAF